MRHYFENIQKLLILSPVKEKVDFKTASHPVVEEEEEESDPVGLLLENADFVWHCFYLFLFILLMNGG